MTSKRKYRRKYKQGERITGLDELVQQEFVMVNGKVYHRGWVCSWPINLARNYLQRGCYKAVSISKEQEVKA